MPLQSMTWQRRWWWRLSGSGLPQRAQPDQVAGTTVRVGPPAVAVWEVLQVLAHPGGSVGQHQVFPSQDQAQELG